MAVRRQKYWHKLQGQQLLKLIVGVSAMAIAYEGMSQGVMGAVNVAPEYGVSVYVTSHLHESMLTPGRDEWALRMIKGTSSNRRCKEELLPSITPVLSLAPFGRVRSRIHMVVSRRSAPPTLNTQG